MRPDEIVNGFARELQSLSKVRRLDLQDLGRLRPRQLHDVAEDERDPMRTIQALEHGQTAPDLDLVDQQGPFRLGDARRFDPFDQVFGEPLEREFQSLARSRLRGRAEDDA